jgi:hypothetical protein
MKCEPTGRVDTSRTNSSTSHATRPRTPRRRSRRWPPTAQSSGTQGWNSLEGPLGDIEIDGYANTSLRYIAAGISRCR